METIDIQIENDCYQYKANDDDLLLYNKSYRLPFFLHWVLFAHLFFLCAIDGKKDFW